MEIKGKVGSRETLNKIEGEGWYLNERISKGRIGFCWTKCREEGSAVPPQVCFSPLLVGSLTSRVSLSGTKQKSGDSPVGPSLPHKGIKQKVVILIPHLSVFLFSPLSVNLQFIVSPHHNDPFYCIFFLIS